MNWNNVESLPTTNDKAVLIGTIKEHKGGGMTANQKPFSKISITDDNGKTKNAKIYGENQPSVGDVGRRYQFQLGWYDYTYQGTSGRAFSGFWNPNANVGQAQQQPQPQQQYTPVKKEPDWDKIAEGKVLCNVICAAIQSGQMECKTLEHVKMCLDVIMGRTPLVEKTLIQQVQEDIDTPPEFGAADDDTSMPF